MWDPASPIVPPTQHLSLRDEKQWKNSESSNLASICSAYRFVLDTSLHPRTKGNLEDHLFRRLPMTHLVEFSWVYLCTALHGVWTMKCPTWPLRPGLPLCPLFSDNSFQDPDCFPFIPSYHRSITHQEVLLSYDKPNIFSSSFPCCPQQQDSKSLSLLWNLTTRREGRCGP